MILIGCDFHPSYQQIAMLDTETGVLTEKTLVHEGPRVRAFYETLPRPARVGVEASGQSQWFERLLEEMGHQVWMGDAAKIRQRAERKQKTDRRDALLLLELLEKEEFPRIWVPNAEQRDTRQLLLHRYKLVRLRVQVKNQLQALALNQGLRKKRKLWSAQGRAELNKLVLRPWAERRRQDLLALLEDLDRRIEELDGAVCREAQRWAVVPRLMTHPGVGPVTALAFVLTLGPIARFPRGKNVASYFGLIPSEHSSGGKQRLGHISKQGNSFLRGLLVEAAQSAVRHDPEMRRGYQRLAQRKCRAIAKVAMARKLAVRLYWMLRRDIDYEQLLQGSHAGQPESCCGRGRDRSLE
jgi:transposase